ncbi:hypothetical protein FF38_13414 [Lucilia cuprina]|uniref:Uncharacterized protein n=1 Tax=Lucilia cuprina TaxID=7375 RepID=A0A0L0CMI9_LUCCU|nr:hypothetical protein FF38_13414 [Lucilia cuprina]
MLVEEVESFNTTVDCCCMVEMLHIFGGAVRGLIRLRLKRLRDKRHNFCRLEDLGKRSYFLKFNLPSATRFYKPAYFYHSLSAFVVHCNYLKDMKPTTAFQISSLCSYLFPFVLFSGHSSTILHCSHRIQPSFIYDDKYDFGSNAGLNVAADKDWNGTCISGDNFTN